VQARFSCLRRIDQRFSDKFGDIVIAGCSSETI